MPRFSDDVLRATYGLSYGEVLGLLELLDQHAEPVAFDLISLGLRLRALGTDALTWADLLAVVRQSPRTSALYRAMNPEEAPWGLTELLLAEVVDALRVANWQRGSGKRNEYPKPLPRPGVEPDSVTYGHEALPMDAMAEWLGWQ